MLAVKGVYDGQVVRLLEPVKVDDLIASRSRLSMKSINPRPA